MNEPPVAEPDTATTPEGTAATGNVLGNDSDPDGNPLTVTQYQIDTDGDGVPETFTAGDPAVIAGVGTLTLGADGGYTFTPEPGFTGEVPQAQYTVSDGAATTTSTLDITVDAVNEPPVAQPDTATVPEGTAATGNVLGNDSDPDGNPLTVTQYQIDTDGDGVPETFTAGEPAVIAGVGTLTLGADGGYTFTPEPGFTGEVPQAQYTVSDGAETTTSTLDITVDAVNEPPVAEPDTATVPEGTAATGNVLGNDSDPDGNPLTVTQYQIDTDGDGVPETFTAGDPAVIAGVGTLTLGADGGYTFTPEPASRAKCRRRSTQ